jgi:hypothetical protein
MYRWLWMILWVLPQVSYGQAPLATLDRGTAYELVWNAQEAQWQARIYLTRTPAKAQTPLVVRLTSLAVGERTDPRLSGAFTITALQSAAGATYFDILGKEDAAVVPGTYHATLVFDDGQTPSSVSLQLTLPSAVLSGPSSVRLTRVLHSPLEVDNPRIDVWETSGRSFAQLRAYQSEPFATSEGQSGGQVRVSEVRIEAGGSNTLTYTLDGTFPLGTVASKLMIASGQSAPLVIPVQVHTRRSWWWLYAFICVGLGAGFLTRSILKPRIDTGEARERASQAHAVLAKEEAKGDASLREAIRNAVAALEVAIQSSNATATQIDQAIGAANTAREQAFAALKTRMDQAQSGINAMARLVSTPWRLPAAIEESLATLKTTVARATRYFEVSDAQGALTALQEAQPIRLDLVRRVQEWSDSVADQVHALGELLALIEAAQREGARTLLAEFGQSAKLTLNLDDAAQLQQALEVVHRAQLGLPRLRARLAEGVSDTFDGMNKRLSTISLAEAASWAAARRATRASVAAWKALDAPVADVRAQAKALLDQWSKAFSSQLEVYKGANADAVNAAIKAFEQGQYREAAEAFERLSGVQAQVQPLGDENRPAASERRPETIAADAVLGVTLEASAQAETVRAPVVSRRSLDAFLTQERRDVRRAKRVQLAISWLGLSMVGFAIFFEKFVGTGGELLAAFFWGLTTDIGVDALLSAAKNKPNAG